MSSDLVHTDTGTIKILDRAGNFLILLPHIDLQGVKKMPLPVPVALADKLSAGTSGSTTHAFAILARWVLEDLIKPDMQLIARSEGAAFAFELKSREENSVGDSSMPVQVYGQLDPKGTRPILASLPPALHEKLREMGSGSMRQTLLALLQYGLEQLDKIDRTLTLIKPETESVEDKAVILLVDGSGSCEHWINQAVPVMQWLGYRVEVAQKQDLQHAPKANCVGMFVVSRPREVVPDWLLDQTVTPVFGYEIELDAAGAFSSPDGVLSRHKRPKFLNEARSAYCEQCDRGVSVIEESECRRDANKMYHRVYCRACKSLFGLDR
ncbi:hypothetical protein [Sulfuriferula nivalis]|uniref:Uncharacterized protein n=1 Tax=Sulfuriferula nivalis TaxID=2675298 RepID=A0A809S741_9PROT|nr:hypothetical protein [Sulfuriferula nivalis]BBO99502.1 hypothetical protein SFSGTM_02110 [Sulfuriferula nivalis]